MSGSDMPPVDPSLVDFAVAVVREAGEATLPWFRASQAGELEVERKADDTPVTAADRAAERLVRERIAERFPADGVLGEEEAETAGTSGHRWIVDPIDGTIAFTRGVPLYSTLLALEDEHGPAVGVIGLPALGEVVYAGRGRGCWFDGGQGTPTTRGAPPLGRRPARVSDTATLSGAVVTTSGYAHWSEDALLAVKRAGCRLAAWGDGYGYALVATGRADAMVDPTVALYDVAAMPVILAEAGGRFTNLAGAEGADGGSGVATNGHLHAALLATLASRSQP